MRTQIRLIVVEGPKRDQSFKFNVADRLLLGRSPEAHLRLPEDDPHVSRNHCVVEVCPPTLFLKDLGSLNGTWVNSIRISETELHDGDLVRVGRTVLKVEGTRGPETREVNGAPEVSVPIPDLPEQRAEGFGLPVGRAVAPRCLTCSKEIGAVRMVDWGADVDACFLCEGCASLAADGSTLGQIGEYRLLRELGAGGMGVVFEAWHPPTARLVAVKRIRTLGGRSSHAQQLFQREISVLRELSHPNIVRYLDQGSVESEPFLVSEYLAGGDLAKLIAEVRREPLPWAEALRIGDQVLCGLQHAHERGYIHRDIKPQNILLQRGARTAKLSDFGLAKSFSEAGASCLTRHGDVAGTLLFMAPEQIVNYRFVKPPADIYSLGVTLYYLVSGRFPFEFPSPLDKLLGRMAGRKVKDEIRIVLEDSPTPVARHQRSLPAEAAYVIDKSIRKDEFDRFKTAEEMRDAVLQVLAEADGGGVR
jgi:serine/threonine-protein kinase